MPLVAGVLNIVTGALSLLGSIIVSLGLGVFFTSTYWTGPGGIDASTVAIWTVFFLPYFIVGAVAIAGGIYAIRRRLWGLALAGAICSLMTIWAWPLGVASIIFIALSKNEFNHVKPTQQPVEEPPPLPPHSTLPPQDN